MLGDPMKVLFLLAAVLAVTAADDSYVVVAPKSIRPGMTCTLSVNILRAAQDVIVDAMVIDSQSNPAASGTGVFQQGVPGELNIAIPHNITSQIYSLNVQGSGGLQFDQTRSLMFESKQMSVFIQTDKSMYKPGDTVNFRVLTVYPDLKPYDGPVDIFISDSGANKIRQFIGVEGLQGVITKSLSLSTQPVLGDWKIQVNVQNTGQSKIFTIDEYVLPKFEVDVIMPSYVVKTDKEVSFTVKAKYTYGKPVKGNLEVAVKLYYSYQDFDSSRNLPIFSTQLNIDGEAKVSFPMTDALAITKYLNGRKFTAKANVTETLTGNTLSGSGTVKIYSTAAKLEFPSSNSNTFKPGLTYTAYLVVSQQDGVPFGPTNKQVTISTRVTALKDVTATAPPHQPWWSPDTVSSTLPDTTLTVSDDGLVLVPITVPANAKNIYMTAKYEGSSASLNVGKAYSPSASYMQLSLASSTQILAGNPFQVNVKSTQPLGQMIYQVLSRGQIVAIGNVDGNSQSDVTFSVPTSSKMAPNARIVVYYVRKDGEIVTDSISFDVAGIFKNKVGISINQTEAEPGEPVKVTVTADPLSHAHLLAVDQSVLLLKSGNDITESDVYDEIKSYDPTTFDNVSPLPFIRRKRDTEHLRQKRMIWFPYPVYYGGSDATSIFKNAGVMVITDALLFKHVELMPIYPVFDRIKFNKMTGPEAGFAVKPFPNVPQPSLKKPTTVRSDFPESWIWTSISVGHDGKAEVMTPVPDTITSWVATAFAVNPDSGLGVAPTAAKMKVFKPFFVSLNLPYSVVRGEHVTLQAMVFNYMTTDQQVRVILQQSNSFVNIKVDSYGEESMYQGNAVQNIMVRAGEAKSVYFPIVPAILGHVDVKVQAQSTQAADALRRQLLVEAEGVHKEYNVPLLIEIQNGTYTKDIQLTLPPNVVDGSQSAKVGVIGDIMGPSISGIDKLLRMPTGCGEQTMLGLAPDVYVTDYLTSTNQLMGDIKSKALGFMEKGYQRELTYKHRDGSFSAFGNSDKSGSMWLTAFVSRVFHQARAYIFVDDYVITNAISWMLRHQHSNGSFPEPGRIIHKNMQGKAGSGASLTTFVLISLLENRDLFNDEVQSSTYKTAIQKALSYVEMEVLKSNDLYLKAMASYAFQLAGSSQTDQLLQSLDQLADHTGGLWHLHQPESKKATTGTWRSPNPTSAVDTEMTSYVLMTYALRHDVAFGSKPMKWITQQRNANGGFSSTQDTVVALNGLSLMAEQLYSNNFDLNVDVTMDTNPKYSFHIDSTNSAIMQRRQTPTVPTEVHIDAKGSGTAIVEVAVSFNVESEIEDTTFDLKVMLLEETLNKLKVQSCASWLGDGEASGMAVFEIGIPSGFEADLESFPDLPTLKRKETQDKLVVLYFDEIGIKPECVDFNAVRTGLVTKSQPAPIRVYDYYEPSNQVTGFYNSQILKNANVCDVCSECQNCGPPRKE